MSSRVNGHVWQPVTYNGILRHDENDCCEWRCIYCKVIDLLYRSEIPPEAWGGECLGDDLSARSKVEEFLPRVNVEDLATLEIEALNQRVADLEVKNSKMSNELLNLRHEFNNFIETESWSISYHA